MNRFFKWLLTGLGLIFSAALLAGIVLAVLLYRTLPDDNAEVALAGLDSQANVHFDENGVPHVAGASVTDTMRVFGYIHARDRLWQMEFLRRVGEGRLSEVLGEATVGTDIFLRTLDMASPARKSYASLLPETKAALEAYASGVNAYINRPTRMLESSLPAEFMILGHEPEPWEAWNSILVLKVMGLTLGHNMDREIQRLAMAANGFAPKEIEEIVSYSPRDNPPPLPDLRKMYGLTAPGQAERASKTQLASAPLLDRLTGQSASNNWVISGSRTVSGKPLLANDPHLGLTAPSAFYLAHLSWVENGETHHIAGGTLPGIPFVVAGRNSKVAWGLTTTNLDSQDVFLEAVNPENPDQYKTEDGWETFETNEVQVSVSDGEPVSFERRVTRHGPVLPGSFRNLGTHMPENMVASLRWYGLAEDDTSIDTLFLNGKATSVDEALDGVKRAVSPMQSVVIADIEGNIALATPGRVPVRLASNDLAGRAPAPGWLPQYQWQEPVESRNVPVFKNPDTGAFTTANAKFFPDGYPLHISYDWAEHFRQARAEKLVLERKEPHDVESSRKIMADDLSAPLLRLARLSARQARTGAGRTGNVLQALARWDGRMQVNRAEPLIALALFRHLHENILQDDLGDDYALFARGRITRLIGIMERGTLRNWCDDLGTPKTESCGDMVMKSLDEAMSELESAQGADWRAWEYGNAHMAYSEHRPFGSVEPLNRFFNIEIPSGGGPYTLHRGQTDFSKERPYLSRHGGSYRAVYDFSDLDSSLYMISSGQSGNFLSKHYSDLARKWSKSEFIRITTDSEQIERSSAGKWVFNPQ